jgi:hypothetical protein
MRKSVVFLLIVMLTAMLGGCILSKTPSTNIVEMAFGEQMTFSVNVFPTGGSYVWSLDDTTLPNTGKSYVYMAEAGDHTLTVKATHILGTDTQTWSIQVSSPPVANAGADKSVYAYTTVSLDGSDSTDPANDIVSYQ